MFHSRCNTYTSGPREQAGSMSDRRKRERTRKKEAATATATTVRRVTFKTVLRNPSDLVYFRRYRCHACSVTVALNQQRHELSRGLRSRKAIYVTRENVNDSRSSSSMLSRSLSQFAIHVHWVLTHLNYSSWEREYLLCPFLSLGENYYFLFAIYLIFSRTFRLFLISKSKIQYQKSQYKYSQYQKLKKINLIIKIEFGIRNGIREFIKRSNPHSNGEIFSRFFRDL